MNYPNNHKHKFFQKDHEKMMCSECEFELDGEYYVGYVLPLEAQVAELEAKLRQDVSTREQHWSIQAELYRLKAEQAEKRVKFFERATCVTPKGWLYFMGLEEVVKDLTAQLEDMKNMWRNAEDANIKLSEKIVEYRKLLEKDSDLQAKMADGWCLVSPEDFERLQEAKRVGD